MSREYFFEIPENLQARKQLVEAIPSQWSWIDGRLIAPKRLVVIDRVDENTGIEFSRSYNPQFVGRYEVEKEKTLDPNLVAIVVEEKLPGFYKFDEAGYSNSFEVIKRIVAGLLSKGYSGKLTFFSGCQNNNKYDNPALCEVQSKPWVGAPFLEYEAGPQPPRIKVEFNSHHGGTEVEVAPIIQKCHSLGLREYFHHQ